MAEPAPRFVEPAQRTDEGSPQSRLDNLIAQATAKYAVKDFTSAAELYSRGTELQSEINGELSTENADLLYLYGRCLYHVAVANSDVLGTKVAGDQAEQISKDSNGKKGKNEPKTAFEGTSIAEDAKPDVSTAEGTTKSSTMPGGKPFFQFTGDENFDASEDEDEDGNEEDGEGAEVEDDFANAFEMLDLARVLLERKLAQTDETDDIGKGKSKNNPSDSIIQLKERLADTYDLQAEISLENEHYPNAATDLKSALRLQQELKPEDASVIAETHYKLSLALEFSSMTQQRDINGEIVEGKAATIDWALRDEAVKEMELAISSCKTRIEKEEAALASGQPAASGDSKRSQITRDSIDDVKEMVLDMEQRLVELRQPPVSVNEQTALDAMHSDKVQGILGTMLGSEPETQKTRLEEASKGANDLTGLVKRKKVETSVPAALLPADAPSTLKRKSEPSEKPSPDKKARVADTDE